MKRHKQSITPLALTAVLLLPSLPLVASPALADTVTDWNVTATQLTVAAIKPPGPANRVLALVQTAVYEATNAITKKYPASALGLNADANKAVLAKLLKKGQADIDKAYTTAIGQIPPGAAKERVE